MTRRPQIIAHHLIWTLYAHWLPNDLRGSGSEKLDYEKLAELGPIHHGRKPAREQPTRGELRKFQQQAEPLLKYKRCWIDENNRAHFTTAFAEEIQEQTYTVYASAILSNHVHMVIRKHRDDALTMRNTLAEVSRLRFRRELNLSPTHPVWADRPFKVFLYTPEDIRRCVRYVEQNPEKEGLPPQSYDFVTPYNNWPFHKK
ncbi:MAG: transposase [Aeoliella sp.]